MTGIPHDLDLPISKLSDLVRTLGKVVEDGYDHPIEHVSVEVNWDGTLRLLVVAFSEPFRHRDKLR